MDQLKYYTKENNFYTGVNTPQFKNLEFWIDSNLDWINEDNKLRPTSDKQDYLAYYANMPENIVSLGLFGEASAGKTSAIRYASTVLGKQLLTFNGAQFQNGNFEELILEELLKIPEVIGGAHWRTSNCLIDTAHYITVFPQVIFFIDECHELPRKIQTKFLSLLEGPINERMITIDFSDQLLDQRPNDRDLYNRGLVKKFFFGRDIMLNKSIFAFATTDPSKMLQPLISRLHRVTFDRYSIEDVTNIIKLKFPEGETEGLRLIAKCSKCTPREAILMATQINIVYKSLSKETCLAYLIGVINMDTNGLDTVDYRLLRFLIGHKKELTTRQKIELKTNKSVLAHLLTKTSKTESEQRSYMKSLAVVTTLSEVEMGEFTPKGKEDIAMSCGMYDFKDVDRRLSFMQSLGLVEKTSKGVLYVPTHGLTLDETKLL